MALNFDNRSLLPIVSQNYFDREQYVKEIVAKLSELSWIPVLAHLFSCHLSDRECLQLAERFRMLTDAYPAAMEVYYRRYDEETMKKLREIADKMELYYSIGSDYHGKETDDLMQVSEIDEEGRKKLVSNLLKKRGDHHE